MTMLAARPTTYNGIEMRSRLEARFAAFVDRAGFNWEYEPRAYASADGQYLPDFVLDDRVFVEVKGDLSLDRWQGVRNQMSVVWASRPDAILLLAVDEWYRAEGMRSALMWRDGGRIFFGGFVLCRCGFTTLGMDASEPTLYAHGCSSPRIAAWLDPFSPRSG